jgi:ribonucleotide monophosphatase NagD (HAD superfamily)
MVSAALGPDGMVVGDRADTDGAFAVTMGYRFGLVLSGVTSSADLPTEPPADVVADDLLSLVRRTLSHSDGGR